MTISLPFTDDLDRLGRAVYDALMAAGLVDKAVECGAMVRSARDMATAMDLVREHTPSDLMFDWKVG